jgi:hypothetical protein
MRTNSGVSQAAAEGLACYEVFWNEQLNALKDFLEDKSREPKPSNLLESPKKSVRCGLLQTSLIWYFQRQKRSPR